MWGTLFPPVLYGLQPRQHFVPMGTPSLEGPYVERNTRSLVGQVIWLVSAVTFNARRFSSRFIPLPPPTMADLDEVVENP